MTVLCPKSVHDVPAHTLEEENRVLLKDLRVLSVTQMVERGESVLIRYYELAAQERGEIEVSRNQRVKIVCSGRCCITRELETLI